MEADLEGLFHPRLEKLMPKGVAKDALSNSGTANTLGNQLTANASNLYGSLAPELEAEAAHPAGYTPQQKALMNTAAQQSAGGSTAGAIGQGALYAARTRNAGGAKAAIGQGVRGAGQNLSNAAVGTELSNANLQQRQQQAGMSGLESLYGTDIGAGENALGLSNNALGVANQADANNPWMKILQTGMSAAGDAASGGAFGSL